MSHQLDRFHDFDAFEGVPAMSPLFIDWLETDPKSQEHADLLLDTLRKSFMAGAQEGRKAPLTYDSLNFDSSICARWLTWSSSSETDELQKQVEEAVAYAFAQGVKIGAKRTDKAAAATIKKAAELGAFTGAHVEEAIAYPFAQGVKAKLEDAKPPRPTSDMEPETKYMVKIRVGHPTGGGGVRLFERVCTRHFTSFPTRKERQDSVHAVVSSYLHAEGGTGRKTALIARAETFQVRGDGARQSLGHINFSVKVVTKQEVGNVEVVVPEDGRCSHYAHGGPCALNESVAPNDWCENCKEGIAVLRGASNRQNGVEASA